MTTPTVEMTDSQLLDALDKYAVDHNSRWLVGHGGVVLAPGTERHGIRDALRAAIAAVQARPL